MGGTFLDWSIRYLSGVTHFVNTRLGVIPLIENPLIINTAHGHLKNHPHGVNEFKNAVEKLLSSDAYSPHIIYANGRRINEVFKEVSDAGTITDDSIYNHVNNVIETELLEIHRFCNNKNIPLINLELTTDPLYLRKYRGDGLLLLNGEEATYDAKLEEFKQFFNNGVLFGKDDATYAKREFIALNIRPFTLPKRIIDSNLEHIHLSALDLWTIGEIKIAEILSKVGIPLDQTRISNWREVYRIWSQKQNTILSFSRNFDVICNSILNNYYHDLSVYELDLFDEAIIQHALIYRHGLTLKSWGLNKFPDNTKKLYPLLEKNVYHPVEDIYGVLNK